jgi:hypothetical protein
MAAAPLEVGKHQRDRCHQRVVAALPESAEERLVIFEPK